MGTLKDRFTAFFQKAIKWITDTANAIGKFFSESVWRISTETLPRWTRPLVNLLQIILLLLDVNRAQKVRFQTMSLAFRSILSIVPLLAIIIFFAQGFGAVDLLSGFLHENVSNQELIDDILSAAEKIVDTATSSLFGFISMFSFIWIIIGLMMMVRDVFNNIWDVREKKNYGMRVLIALGTSVLTPLIIILFFAGSVWYSTILEYVLPQRLIASGGMRLFFSWGGFAVMTILILFIMYKLVPSTKVKAAPALVAAVIAGLGFTLVQFLYLETQTMVAKQSAIYGVLALFPLFMIWMNMAWNIVLQGVSLCYTLQNEDVKRFFRSRGPLAVEDLSGQDRFIEYRRYLQHLRDLGEIQALISFIDSHLPDMRLLSKKDPGRYMMELAYFLYEQGKAYRFSGRYSEALTSYKETLKAAEEINWEDDSVKNSILGSTYYGMSICHEMLSSPEEALSCSEEALRYRRIRLEQKDFAPLEKLAQALSQNGRLLLEKDPATSQERLSESVALYTTLLKEAPEGLEHTSDLADAKGLLADATRNYRLIQEKQRRMEEEEKKQKGKKTKSNIPGSATSNTKSRPTFLSRLKNFISKL